MNKSFIRSRSFWLKAGWLLFGGFFAYNLAYVAYVFGFGLDNLTDFGRMPVRTVPLLIAGAAVLIVCKLAGRFDRWLITGWVMACSYACLWLAVAFNDFSREGVCCFDAHGLNTFIFSVVMTPVLIATFFFLGAGYWKAFAGDKKVIKTVLAFFCACLGGISLSVLLSIGGASLVEYLADTYKG